MKKPWSVMRQDKLARGSRFDVGNGRRDQEVVSHVLSKHLDFPTKRLCVETWPPQRSVMSRTLWECGATPALPMDGERSLSVPAAGDAVALRLIRPRPPCWRLSVPV